MADHSKLESDLIAQIAGAADEAALEAVRVSALGKKGSVSELLKGLGAMSPDERKAEGAKINALRDRVTGALEKKKAELKEKAIAGKLAAETADVTLPVRAAPAESGRIHPISQVIDELTAIFADMGFSVAEGPDVETDFYNFTALNFPVGHPAREMHDTFFFPPDEKGERKLLRTHTSPVQVRSMLKQKPPIKIIIPGRTYRSDS
ncbi:MAG: phenylalanine--tRNA ligase subunit alpha, partial [Xanthobacteraceae bacterium]|nr:phenylalanine--tRNA ligase subunit alpha [Xanthobacteraceae bacterium]